MDWWLVGLAFMAGIGVATAVLLYLFGKHIRLR